MPGEPSRRLSSPVDIHISNQLKICIDLLARGSSLADHLFVLVKPLSFPYFNKTTQLLPQKPARAKIEMSNTSTSTPLDNPESSTIVNVESQKHHHARVACRAYKPNPLCGGSTVAANQTPPSSELSSPASSTETWRGNDLP